MTTLFVAKMEPSVAICDRNKALRYYILGTFPAEVGFQLGKLPNLGKPEVFLGKPGVFPQN